MLTNARLGKWREAFAQANQVALLDHADPMHLASAGRMLEISGVWADAERLYRRFAQDAPHLLFPRFRLCQVLARAGRRAEATGLFDQLKSRAPSNPRIAALQALLVPAAAENVPDAISPGLWRRWFGGEAQWHEGGSVGRAEMAVVVIGFRCQPGLADAVRSILEQGDGAEIVVVNSGGGCPEALLADCASRLRIINILAPLYAGAARNVGIDASAAPYVSFLAADCRARPGWISARLNAHRRGARAVASAIAPPDAGGSLAMAAHISLFGARSPQVPPVQALRYGASYDRQVFREFGYFNPALRISEDTDFARRIGRKVFPIWDPRVLTEHAGPASLVRFVSEMFSRGRRAARHQFPGAGQSAWRLPTALLNAVRQRNEAARRIAREILRLETPRQRAVMRRLLPASLAYGAGILAGLLDGRSAGREHGRSLRAGPDAALRHAGRATRRDPESTAFLLTHAELLRSRPDTDAQEKSMRELDAAGRLSGFREDGLLSLARWLVERGLYERAWMLGDAATFDLPAAAGIHEYLAEAAHARGDAAAFELAALDAFARNALSERLRLQFQAFLKSGPSGA